MATQTRISETAHETLVRLSTQTGKTHQEVMEIALSTYERELFLDSVNAAYADLRSNPDAWKEEEAERTEWEGVLSDGVEV